MSRIVTIAAIAAALMAGCLSPVGPDTVPEPADAQTALPVPGTDASTLPPVQPDASLLPPERLDAGASQRGDAGVWQRGDASLECDLAELSAPATPQQPTPPGWGTDAPSDELRQVAAGMVGTWKGYQSNTWDGQHPVQLTFFADGLYSAAGLDGQPPFYYSAVCNSHQTYWRLDEGNLVQARGELEITFAIGTSTVDEIRHVRLAGETLSFDYWRGDSGPVHFELQRL
ncbi:MAG: hypothetical protein QM765_28670 [Myxococcales bacterium]